MPAEPQVTIRSSTRFTRGFSYVLALFLVVGGAAWSWPWGLLLGVPVGLLTLSIDRRELVVTPDGGITIREPFSRPRVISWDEIDEITNDGHQVVAVMAGSDRFPEGFPYPVPGTKSAELRPKRRRQLAEAKAAKLRSVQPSR